MLEQEMKNNINFNFKFNLKLNFNCIVYNYKIHNHFQDDNGNP